MEKIQNTNCWIFNNECLENQPDGYYGFVYKITASLSETLPQEIRGRVYIGKKQFQYNTKRKLSKKKKKETGKRVERKMIDSKWLSYYGSNKNLIEDVKKYGEEFFIREIIKLCKSKSELSYIEIVNQIVHNVMYCNSYNSWISCRIFKNQLNK